MGYLVGPSDLLLERKETEPYSLSLLQLNPSGLFLLGDVDHVFASQPSQSEIQKLARSVDYLFKLGHGLRSVARERMRNFSCSYTHLIFQVDCQDSLFLFSRLDNDA